MRISFDVKFKPQIESGEYKVETRDGRPARVICWDANSYTPIVYLVTEHDDLDDKDKEYTYSCNNFGRTFSLSIESAGDLFIITPKEEMTEFEQELVNFFKEGNAILPDKDGVYNKHDCEELLHKSANKLLALAEKELSAKYKVSSDLNGFAYGQGYKAGKKEALKDLPRWKRIRDIGDLDFVENDIKLDKVIICPDKEGRMYYIYRTDLFEKLPKEDEE